MNDVNTLMLLVDEINAKNADELIATDIDTLIAYHRRNRARKVSGEKPLEKKGTVDLSQVIKSLKPKNKIVLNKRI